MTGISALLGWVLGVPRLASVGAGLIPMAPSTATLLVLLGTAICLQGRAPRRRGVRIFGASAGSFIVLVAPALFICALLKSYPSIEHLYIPITGEVRGAPVGHMSTITAFCFILAGASMLASLSPAGKRPGKSTLSFLSACVLMAISAVFLLAYILGAPQLYFGTFILPALPTILAFMASGAALAALALPRDWARQRKEKGIAASSSLVLIMIFTILTAGVVAAGIIYYRNYEEQYRNEVMRNLSSVAKLKVGVLSQYRKERFGDASVIYKNEAFSELAFRYFNNPGDTEANRQLQVWMGKLQDSYKYDRVFLMDAKGKMRIDTYGDPANFSSVISRSAAEVMRAGRIVFQDFYRNEHENRVYLALLIPIIDELHGGGAIGILAMRIDPETYLYPMIQTWPTASDSSETLLVRRDGDDALFLNDIRFNKEAALKLRISMKKTDVPAVKAVLGREVVEEGFDYRGVPVMAATRGIPDSSWGIVSKMDLEELYAPIREKLWLVVALVCVMLLGAGLGAGMILRRQTLRIEKEMVETASALQAAEREKNVALYTRSLIEANLDSLVTIGPDGRITDVNKVTVDVTGVPRDQLIGTDFSDYFTEPEKAREGYTQVFSQGAVRDYPLTILHTSGHTMDVLYNASVYMDEDGEVKGVFAAARDITERKKAEKKLRETFEDLERSNNELEQFAYVASHDLQEPLRMVSSYTQLLAQRYKDKLDGDAFDFIQYAVDGAARMQKLINDLLAYSRVSSRGKQPVKADSQIALEEALANLNAAIEESGAVVTTGDLPEVIADPSQITQVFQNLVGNAIKFRGEEVPQIHVSAIKGSGEWLFTVKDNGIGIDPKYFDKIFVIFQRLHGREEYSGTGIGLAICKRIIERHGGRIWLESRLGAGTSFHFSLPIKGRKHFG